MLKAIFIIVILVLFVSCEQVTELEFEEVSISENENNAISYPSGSPGDLYSKNCKSCHGDLINSSKLDRSVAQISSAINNISSMNYLSSLTADELNKIEEALSFKPPTMNIDSSPSGIQPSTTSSVELTVTTNEEATCKYAPSDRPYNSMTLFLTSSSDKKTHTKQINVDSGTSYIYYIHCEDHYGNKTIDASEIRFSIESEGMPDTTAPELRDFSLDGVLLSISSELSSGSTSVAMGLKTNEAATCKYSSSSSANYSQMSTMITTGSLNHSQLVSGLSNGQSYTYYILCQDGSGNTSNKGTVNFSVLEPVNMTGTQLYDVNCKSCHGSLSNSTKLNRSAAQISSAISNVSSMNSLSSLSDSDLSKIESALSFNPPEMNISLSPSGVLPNTTTSVSLDIRTNEFSTCKMSTLANQGFDQMTLTLSTSGSQFTHTRQVTTTPGTSYHYYVHCRDSFGNTTTNNAEIIFSVEDESVVDNTAPSITDVLLGGTPLTNSSELPAGTTNSSISFKTNENANCKYSTLSTATYSQMIDMTTTGTLNHSVLINGLVDGQNYHYYIFCRDVANNISTKETISFDILNASQIPGAELYATNCKACHGPLESSTKRTRSAAQIKTAIQNTPAMQSTSLQALTDNEIDLIAQGLNTSVVVAVDENKLNVSLRVGSRRYILSVFKEVFGYTFDQLGNPVHRNKDFGGGCDYVSAVNSRSLGSEFPEEACPSGIGSVLKPILSSSRSATTIFLCEGAVGGSGARFRYAMDQTGGSNNPWTSEQFKKVYQLFYVHEEPEEDVIQGFKDIFDSRAQSYNNVGWKAVVLGVCLSPEWQIIR